MAKKQIVRTTQRTSIADFDEQLWPVNCALLMLAGFIAGLAIAVSKFEGVPPHENGYVRLAFIGLSLAVLMAGSFWLHRRRSIRRMQLAVLLSLLLNLGLQFGLYKSYLRLAVEPPDRDAAVEDWIQEEQEIVALPDYGPRPEETAVDETLTKPLETALPEIAPQQTVRQERQTQPKPLEREAPAVALAAQAQPSPSELERAKLAVAAPRRSEDRSGLQVSRQELKAPGLPLERVPQDEAPLPAAANETEAAVAQLAKAATSDPQVQNRESPRQPLAAAAAPQAVEAQAAVAERNEAELAASGATGEAMAAKAAAAKANLPANAQGTAAMAAVSGDNPGIPATSAAGELAKSNSSRPAAPANAGAANVPLTSSVALAAAAGGAAARRETTSGGAAMSPQALGRTAATPSPSLNASAIGEAVAATVAEAGGSPAPSANAQAATVGRTSGAVQLSKLNGPAQPLTGEAANTSAGVASTVRRAATASDPALIASNPGAGQLARSQGAAGAGPAAPAIPLEGAPAAGSIGGEANNEPRPSIAGLGKSNGNSVAVARSTSDGGAGIPNGISGQPAAASLSRANGIVGGTGPTLSGAAGSAVARTAAAPAEPAGTAAEALGPVPAGVGDEPRPVTPPSAATAAARGSTSDGNASRPANTGAGLGLPVRSGISATAGSSLQRSSSTSDRDPQLSGATGMNQGKAVAQAVLPAGLATADEAGPVAGVVSDEPGLTGQPSAAGELPRTASGAVPVNVNADSGVGALTADARPAVPGLPLRTASRLSDNVALAPQRFNVDRAAGGSDAAARVLGTAAPAFVQRDPEKRQGVSQSRGGSAGSEKAVEMGLDYLAKQQLADGRWSLQTVTGTQASTPLAGAGAMQADTAATGLALLCFLGAGYDHVDGKYRDTVEAGLAYLLRHQKADGDLFFTGGKYCWFYSHGIASISLCEAYGMTGDPKLKEPAQRALNFILRSQDASQGGWRYAPQTGSDTSVSGWQLMALKSGELAGLDVPPQAYARVTKWLDGAQGPGSDGSRYAYRPQSTVSHQRDPTPAMTAEGLLMRLYTGWDKKHPGMLTGADVLRSKLPSVGTRQAPERDAYYWYYATQVMFQMQGDHWTAWNDRLRELLISSQTAEGALAGSWDPRGPAIPDRWGVEAGRLYVTAMHLLMLEVYYRHLPLYQTLEK